MLFEITGWQQQQPDYLPSCFAAYVHPSKWSQSEDWESTTGVRAAAVGAGYKKPAGLDNFFHRLKLQLVWAAWPASTSTDVSTFRTTMKVRTRLDSTLEDAFCQATRQTSSASQTIMKTRLPTWWSRTGWSWTELRSWPGTASTTCSARAGLSSSFLLLQPNTE